MNFVFTYSNDNKYEILNNNNNNKIPTCNPTKHYQLFVEHNNINDYDIVTSEPTELVQINTHKPSIIPQIDNKTYSCVCNIERNSDNNNENLIIATLFMSTLSVLGIILLIYYKYYAMKNKKVKTRLHIDEIDFGIRGSRYL